MKRAQAMLETLIALLVIMLIFTSAHLLSRKLAARTLLDYGAARAARAKAVGFNDFMCEKSAKAAIIPVAGRRLWPDDPEVDEVSRVPIYLSSEDPARANAVLEYERWGATDIHVDSQMGLAPVADASIEMQADDFTAFGEAKIESHFPFYMYDAGL